MARKSRNTLALAWGSAALTLLQAPGAVAAEAGSGLEEVIVTAQKRE